MNNAAFENEADKQTLPPPPPYEEGNFWNPRWYMAPRSNVEPGGYPTPPHPQANPQAPPYPEHPYPVYLEDSRQWPTAVTSQQPASVTPTRESVTPARESVTPARESVPSYLGYSIITMIFCCLPLGLAALICSLRTLEERTNRRQALKSSRTALILNHVALALGGLSIFLLSILVLFLFLDWS